MIFFLTFNFIVYLLLYDIYTIVSFIDYLQEVLVCLLDLVVQFLLLISYDIRHFAKFVFILLLGSIKVVKDILLLRRYLIDILGDCC